MTTTTYTATTKQTAAAIRKELRATYPDTRFSVRMATGTAYGWIGVRWTDGPTERAVRELLAGYQSARFDGTDDAYHSTGVTEWSCSGITTHREHSADRLAYAHSILTRDAEGWLVARDEAADVRAPWEHADEDMVARIWCQETSG